MGGKASKIRPASQETLTKDDFDYSGDIDASVDQAQLRIQEIEFDSQKELCFGENLALIQQVKDLKQEKLFLDEKIARLESLLNSYTDKLSHRDASLNSYKKQKRTLNSKIQLLELELFESQAQLRESKDTIRILQESKINSENLMKEISSLQMQLKAKNKVILELSLNYNQTGIDYPLP